MLKIKMTPKELALETLKSKIEISDLKFYFPNLDINNFLDFICDNENSNQILSNVYNDKLEMKFIKHSDIKLFTSKFNYFISHQNIFELEYKLYNKDLLFFEFLNEENNICLEDDIKINYLNLHFDKSHFFIFFRNKFKLLRCLPINFRDLIEFNIYLP